MPLKLRFCTDGSSSDSDSDSGSGSDGSGSDSGSISPASSAPETDTRFDPDFVPRAYRNTDTNASAKRSRNRNRKRKSPPPAPACLPDDMCHSSQHSLANSEETRDTRLRASWDCSKEDWKIRKDIDACMATGGFRITDHTKGEWEQWRAQRDRWGAVTLQRPSAPRKRCRLNSRALQSWSPPAVTTRAKEQHEAAAKCSCCRKNAPDMTPMMCTDCFHFVSRVVFAAGSPMTCTECGVTGKKIFACGGIPRCLQCSCGSIFWPVLCYKEFKGETVDV